MPRVKVRDEHWEPALAKLRAICLALPGTTETTSYGNPTFKVGKQAYAILDAYKGGSCIWLNCGTVERERLLREPGFFEAPYDRARSAICRSAGTIDWAELEPIISDSYVHSA